MVDGIHIDINVLKNVNAEKDFRIEKYAYILKNINKIDVSSSQEFQKAYNYFFKVRKNKEWRERYYELMEKAKKEDYSFSDVLYEIYNTTGQVARSFSSKLIHSVNPSMPIWDSFVIKNLGIKIREKDNLSRLKEATYIYNCLQKQMDSFLKTEKARFYISEFDKRFPEYSWFSDMKKIDFLIWRTR